MFLGDMVLVFPNLKLRALHKWTMVKQTFATWLQCLSRWQIICRVILKSTNSYSLFYPHSSLVESFTISIFRDRLRQKILRIFPKISKSRSNCDKVQNQVLNPWNPELLPLWHHPLPKHQINVRTLRIKDERYTSQLASPAWTFDRQQTGGLMEMNQ